MNISPLFKLPIFIVIWLAYMFLLKLPALLTGLFVVPFLWKYRHTDYSELPWWTRVHANPEDWQGQSPDGNDVDSLPRWWHKKHGNSFKSWYRYHAIQNTGNGLRSIEWLDLDIDPEAITYRTNFYMDRYEPPEVRKAGKKFVVYLCWQGWQAGMKLIRIWSDDKHTVIKLGWRVEPSDTKATDLDSLGIKDASFAGKVLFYRNG